MTRWMFFVALAFFSFQLQAQDLMVHKASSISYELTWSEAMFDFGQTDLGTPVSHTFEVVNRTAEPVKIAKVKPSCGCTVADHTKEWIQPGETGTVTATFSAKKKGYFTKQVSVFMEGEESPKVLTIRGEVIE
ncbi:MAG: DUF1573 domain-containing protein [Bacteroidota bacterium]